MRAEEFFNTHQLIVFADTVGTRSRTGLDLTCTQSHCEVGDGSVFSFARAVRHHCSIFVSLSQLNSVDGFGEGTDLVNLDEDRVSHALFKTHSQTFNVGYKQVVAHELALAADGVGEEFPAVPVVFSHTVFDRDDRIFFNPTFPIVNHLARSKFFACGPFEFINAFFHIIEFRRCGVEGDADIVVRFIASVFHSLKDHFNSFFIRFQIRSETAFVANISRIASTFENLLKVMEHLSAHAESFAESRSTHWHNHKFLEIDAVISMRTTIEDIHHRNRENSAVATAYIAIEILTGFLSGSLSSSEGDTEDGICAHITFIFSTVDFNHAGIDFCLVAYVHAFDLFGEYIIYILNSFENAFTQKAVILAISQFYSFVYTSGSAGWDSSAAHCASSGININFNGRITTRV